jgi:hypothetical protein
MTDMTPFTRTIHENQCAISASYKVHGFASSGHVEIGIYSKGGNKWSNPYIHWSDECRDYDEEPDPLIAIFCFADAIKDAVTLAREWKAKYTDQAACTP